MIEKLTNTGKLSGVSSPLLPLLYADYKYSAEDVDGVYIQLDNTETQSFVSVKNGCAVVCIMNENYCAEELKSFLSFLHIEEVLSDYALGDGYKKIPLLKATTTPKSTSELNITSPLWGLGQYKSLHSLLAENSQNFDSWFTDFSRRVNDGFALGVATESYHSCAVAPCVYGDSAIVAGVFTDPAFRHQGLAQKCVDGLLSELYHKGVKSAFLWCNEDKIKFYEKSGFNAIGNVYIREEL